MVMEESDMELASESIPVPHVQEPKVDLVKRNNKSGASHGKPRLRKKALHASIVKQMEFYFSDANLNKDRYLSALLKESPYIDLEIFTRCNKLRELTTDINRIAKALQGSTMLKVSEDGTKVCRLTPIQKKENIDQCTIYVQNLPPDADHDWLISMFSKYGSVDYVSIPRYKNNRKIKGFAFVEFDTPSSAQECIKTFQKKGCVLPSYISPNELLSITTFEEPTKDTMIEVINSKVKIKLKANEKENFNEETGNDIHETDTDSNNIKQSGKKRKCSSEKSFVIDENDIKIKKKKKEIADQTIIDQQNEIEKVPKAEYEDKYNTYDNEINVPDNNSKQSLKKRKYSSEKFDIDEGDKTKKKKKDMNLSIVNKQNEKKKTAKEELEDKLNEINTADHDSYDVKKEKYIIEKSVNENEIKAKKKRKTTEQNITNSQNEKEKISKESVDKDNIYDSEVVLAGNDRQNLKKRKLSLEELHVEDEGDIKASENIENQEISNKNSSKSIEKKKKRFTTEDINIIGEDSGEVIKEEYQKATNSNKEMENLCENNMNDETNILLQTEQITKDIGTKSDIEEISIDERKKKKNRKKRSKIQNSDICSKIGLQIMAKSDWKRLRNRYLDLQRHKMSQLKLHLKKAEMDRGGIMTKNGWYYDKTGQNNISHDKYDNTNVNEEGKCYGHVNYIPGIIVKIEMDEPCTDLQGFKMELKDNNFIKYVDVTADSCEAYVRCDTAESAQLFVQKSYEGKRLTILEGDEERLYWDKISEDRLEKLSKRKRIKQRGREKLLKRAEKELGKCIKFDQD